MKYDKYRCCGCKYVIEIPEGSPKPFGRNCQLTMDMVKRRKRK